MHKAIHHATEAIKACECGDMKTAAHHLGHALASTKSTPSLKETVPMPGLRATMREFKNRSLHSGGKAGPVVTNPKQAVAIALSEERKEGTKVPSLRNRLKRLKKP